MASDIRSGLLRALRDSTQFEIAEDSLEACLVAEPTLLDDPARIAAAERVISGRLIGDTPVPAATRAEVLPVLGNIAEAVVESILADQGWQPVEDDTAGYSSGRGVDLLMLDSTLERLVAIEVKSTIQPSRWPRLASGRREQLTPEWFDSPGNQSMVDWSVGAADVYTMVVQVHLHRRRWRACLAADLRLPHPLLDLEQLDDLQWLDE